MYVVLEITQNIIIRTKKLCFLLKALLTFFHHKKKKVISSLSKQLSILLMLLIGDMRGFMVYDRKIGFCGFQGPFRALILYKISTKLYVIDSLWTLYPF